MNNPANICLLKVNNRNTRKRSETCSKFNDVLQMFSEFDN